MKKLAFLLLLAVTMVFVSCKDESSSNPLTMIPSDANFVAAIDAGSIIKKANIKVENGEVVFPDSYNSLLKNAFNSAEKEMMSEVAKAGIDFSKKTYAFNSTDFEALAIIPITDANAAKAFIEKACKTDMTADGELYKLEAGNEWYFVSGNYIVIAQPSATLETAVAENLIKNLITTGSTNPITNNADAMEMLDRKADVTFFGDYRKLLQMSGNPRELSMLMASGMGSILNDYRSVGATLNFNKKDLEMALEVFANDTENIKSYQAVIGKPSAEGLKFIPADIQFAVSGSVKGKELVKIDAVNQALAQISNNPFVTQDEIKQYLEAIDGPVTFGWNYVDYIINRSSMPQVYGAIKNEKADEICNKLQSTINGFGIIACTKVGDEYVVNISSDMAIAFGSKDGFLHFRTVAQKVTNSLYDDKLARGIFEESPSALYANALQGSRANAMLTSVAPNLNFSGYLKANGNVTDASMKIVIDQPEGNNIIETFLTILANAQMR